MKKKKTNYANVIFWLMIYLGIMFGGIIIGMLLQQAMTQSTLIKVAEGLEGTTFNIDLNETLLVDRMYENFGFDEMDEIIINNSKPYNPCGEDLVYRAVEQKMEDCDCDEFGCSCNAIMRYECVDQGVKNGN